MFKAFVEGLTEPSSSHDEEDTTTTNTTTPTLSVRGDGGGEVGQEGEDAILRGAERGDVRTLERCVSETNVNSDLNGFGATALIVAAARGHSEAVEYLLGVPGCIVDALDKYRRTPLIWAATGGHDAVIHHLLEAGAQIDHVDMFGRTPLFCAIDANSERTIILLLDFFADVNKLKKPASQYPPWVLEYAKKVKARSIGTAKKLETPKRNSRRPIAILIPQADDIEYVSGETSKVSKEDADWMANMLSNSEPFKTLGRTAEFYQGVFYNRPGYLYVLAKVKGERAGVAIIKPFGFAGAPYLATLAVAPDHRCAGLGEKLLAKFESMFPESKHYFLLCSSFNNRAHAFYERHGYVKRGELPDYIIAGASEWIYHKSVQVTSV